MLKFLPKPTAPALESVGNITITDGVATGFTAANVLKSPSTFDYSQDNYEICGRFSLTDANPDNTIFRSLDGGGATIQVINGKIVMFIMFGTDASSTRYDVNYTISNNQIYSFKFKRTNGTKYSLLLGTGNNVPTDEVWSVNNSSDLVNGQSYNIAFGGGSASLTNQYIRGSIYLKGTYITVNNQLVCGEVLAKEEPDKIIIDDGTNQTEANYVILNDKLVWANSNIYIDVSNEPTTPTKFVRTNITINSNSKVEMVFKPSQYSSNYALWCCRNDLQVKTLSIFNVAGNYRFDYYTSQTSIGSSTSLTKTNITADGNKAYVDGTLKATVTAQTFTPDYGMVLFASNTGGGTTYGNGYQGKFYSMKIYLDGTNLSYHFVPVPSGMTIGSYTTPSAGMFDLVNQQFYANSGSGTFTWGKDN